MVERFRVGQTLLVYGHPFPAAVITPWPVRSMKHNLRKCTKYTKRLCVLMCVYVCMSVHAHVKVCVGHVVPNRDERPSEGIIKLGEKRANMDGPKHWSKRAHWNDMSQRTAAFCHSQFTTVMNMQADALAHPMVHLAGDLKSLLTVEDSGCSPHRKKQAQVCGVLFCAGLARACSFGLQQKSSIHDQRINTFLLYTTNTFLL